MIFIKFNYNYYNFFKNIMGNSGVCSNLCSKNNPNGDPNFDQVTKSDFKFHNAIGRGGFGKVWRVEKDG